MTEWMSDADAAWLHMDRPTNRMIVQSVLWFDSPVDWDRLLGAVSERYDHHAVPATAVKETS